MQTISSAQIKAFVIRHRFTIQDLLSGLAVLAVCALFAAEIDLFPQSSAASQKLWLEIDEALALVAIGFGLFAWSRLRAQKRETRRRIAAERAAHDLAMLDPLTTLPNRRQFDICLKEALAKPPRAGAAHAVLAIDLNGFKKVNDLHGHPAGDEVLIQVGARLREAVRDGDLMARLGGDEFAVLATQLAGPEAATGIARRIIDVLSAPIATSYGEHQIGCGIGIALSPQDGTDAEGLLRRADIALYRAKAHTGSNLRFFEHEMDAQVRERDSLERELRAAIGTDALRPHYQPQVELKTGRITGFEALARWTHSTLGEIPPERFIPIADDCGLIAPLTDHLLRQACADAATWPKDTLLSFNISPVQLRDHGLGLRLMGILAETGLPPQRLEIELTESALVKDMDSAREILGAIRDAGVKIALDDFGTGYSSLYHLRNFKLDKIKIDRSFVESMGYDRDSAAIVKALVGLGAGLSLKVTAEGVEDAEQQAMLAETGCDQAQGFLFSHAVPAEEALAMVRAKPKAARRA